MVHVVMHARGYVITIGLYDTSVRNRIYDYIINTKLCAMYDIHYVGYVYTGIKCVRVQGV